MEPYSVPDTLIQARPFNPWRGVLGSCSSELKEKAGKERNQHVQDEVVNHSWSVDVIQR